MSDDTVTVTWARVTTRIYRATIDRDDLTYNDARGFQPTTREIIIDEPSQHLQEYETPAHVVGFHSPPTRTLISVEVNYT